MTRAKQHLHLLVPQRFYVHAAGAVGDRHVYASLTRFITPKVAAAFEAVGPLRRASRRADPRRRQRAHRRGRRDPIVVGLSMSGDAGPVQVTRHGGTAEKFPPRSSVAISFGSPAKKAASPASISTTS